MNSASALLLLVLLFSLTWVALRTYGIILCFEKKWYIGVVAILVPFFGEIVAVAKLAFKKDLLT